MRVVARVKQAKPTPSPNSRSWLACPGPTAFGDFSFKNCGSYLCSYFYSFQMSNNVVLL